MPPVTDSIRLAAMAPTRPASTPLRPLTQPRSEEIQLYLQARQSTRRMELHTGPGAEFPLLGLADLAERYPVVEIKGRWFKIQLEETPGMAAWVAYERVELFSRDKIEE